jgi:hypothetical protein
MRYLWKGCGAGAIPALEAIPRTNPLAFHTFDVSIVEALGRAK